MKKLFLVFIIFLSGCVTYSDTPYQPYQPYMLGLKPSGGYSSLQLDEASFLVSFSGNGYTLPATAALYALLRAAELTTENGFKYFIVAGDKNESSLSTYTSPSQSHTMITPDYATGGYFANSWSYGGQTEIVSRPSTTLTILCFKDRPNAYVLDAEITAKSIREKYKLNKEGSKQPK